MLPLYAVHLSSFKVNILFIPAVLSQFSVSLTSAPIDAAIKLSTQTLHASLLVLCKSSLAEFLSSLMQLTITDLLDQLPSSNLFYLCLELSFSYVIVLFCLSEKSLNINSCSQFEKVTLLTAIYNDISVTYYDTYGSHVLVLTKKTRR